MCKAAASVICALVLFLVSWSAEASEPLFVVEQVASPLPDNSNLGMADRRNERVRLDPLSQATTLSGASVDFGTALISGAEYLTQMQADVTDDNAGNGVDGVNETPDDPDDGGWDWIVTSPPAPEFHTTAASPKNLYGVTVQGLYYAYLATDDPSYLTAMTDAANAMVADAGIRSASDVVFLILFNELPVISGTAYADAAKAKFDARITTYGSATAFAEYIRDARAGQGYENGIIAWDVGPWAVAAAQLALRFPSDPYNYATASADIAEVLWQDSFNGTPGYFDVVADAGWDPGYANNNYWWYTLGITGLIDAFSASGTHTGEIPALIDRIMESQYSTGAVSYCYGANPDDMDWQSTAYAAASLARIDKPNYQTTISHMAYWIGTTQDVGGGWKYSDNSHLPEVGGENTHALALGLPPSVVIVDDDFLGQTEVDAYNTANATSYVWGFDAFNIIQDGIDAVEGSTVNVLAGTYEEQVVIAKSLTLTGAGPGLTVIQSPVTLTASFVTGSTNKPIVFVHDAADAIIENITVDGLGRGNTNVRFTGIAYYNAGGTVSGCEVVGVRNTPINGTQHGVGIYGYVDAATPRAVHVTGTDVSDFQKGGIVFNGTGLTVHISGCNISGFGPANFIAMNGIQIGFSATGTIVGNQIYGCSYTGATDGSAGILLYNPTGPIICTGNTVDECQVGIRFENVGGEIGENVVTATPGGTGLTSYWNIVADPGPGDQRQPPSKPFDAESGLPGETGFVAQTSATGMIITTNVYGNVVDGGGSGTGIEADALGTETLNFTATGNIMTNLEAAMVLDKDAGATLNATIRDNSFANNTYGLYNKTSVAHDARGNYWGDMTGPLVAGSNSTGLGAEISGTPTTGDVLYAPWLCLPDGDAGSIGYQPPVPMTWGMNTETTLIETFGSFTVAGDAIFVRTGTYPEGPQVAIDHDITVFGETEATTTFVPTASTGSTGDARGWFLVNAGVGFNLSNVSLNGAGFSIHQAIRSFGTGTIESCTVEDIFYSQYVGLGIVIVDANMTVSNCTFRNIERIGVFLFGTGATAAIVTNNTFTGKGPGDWLDYGIEIGGGAVASLTGNVISGCRGVASSDGSVSAGVLLTTYYGVGTAGTLEGNDISDCSNGVVVGYGTTDETLITTIAGNSLNNNGVGFATAASPLIALTVYGNMFSNIVNAEDNTTGGNWDDGTAVGNCWSDFDVNSGFPTHYAVAGSAGATDWFPNRDPATCPFCACPYQGDFEENNQIDAVDLGVEIDIVYFGIPDTTDPTCPITRADFNADGFVDSVDLSEIIEYVFFGGPAPTDPCSPKRVYDGPHGMNQVNADVPVGMPSAP